ncbi:hypothetical protein KGF57_001476 [Candida theae]|uniref:Nucleoporin Nup120/160 beta-propeller domain-containing protein n=1 Tax=Candida theae TaxID=1198502 RepID=A0AAD5FZW7_9ASCO|nr:uncharacterized protein KGF57_001476 [Candida theae]KAI5962742.1 hypothetical protein KGF57_001476 [Candida theae]
MSVTYSSSDIVGYPDHLPTFDVKLPLKYPQTPSTTATTTTSTSSSSPPNDQFHLKLAACGQLLKLGSNSLVPLVSSTILNDFKTITLTPIERKLNKLGLKLQNIRIHLPNKLSSTSCFDITHDSENIYINLIDSSYLFISLKIPTETFVSSKTLSLFDFEEWGHISVPYSFEMRSDPYLVKSFDEKNVLVSLKDGGLLHFQKQHPLDSIEISTFAEPVSFLGGIFSGKKKNVYSNGISSNSIVDLIKVDDYLITLTTSRQLKLWSLSKRQYVSSVSLTVDSDEDVWLTTVPSKYLQIVDAGDEQYITLLNPTIGGSKKGKFAFRSWQIQESSLVEVTRFHLEPELPNILLSSSDIFYHESAFQNTIWFIQDFATDYVKGNLVTYILWKSNTSSILVAYTTETTGGATLSIQLSSPPAHNDEETISIHFDSDYYCRKIFDSGRFDNLIVATSLSILRQHFKSQRQENDDDDDDDDDSGTDLRTAALRLIEFHSSNDESDKQIWLKLYSLCEELEKTSQEALGLVTFESQLITTQANGYGLFRPSHYFELFASESLHAPEPTLMQVFNRFRTTLSAKTYHKLSETVLSHRGRFNANLVDQFFQTHLSKKLSPQEIQSALSELEKVHNGPDVLQSLIENTRYQLVSIHNPLRGDLGEFFKISTLITFKDIMQQQNKLLMDVLVLLLICKVNGSILHLIDQVVHELQQYHLIEIIFDTCFESGGEKSPLESHGLSNLDHSLFWSAVIGKDAQLKQYVETLQINDAFEYLWNQTFTQRDFLLNSVIELVNHQQGPYLKKYFLRELDQNEVDELFLIGIVHLINNDATSFYDVFAQFEKLQHLDVSKLKLLKQDENLRHFLSCFYTFPTTSGYYHGLSELAMSQVRAGKTTDVTRIQLTKVALKFEQLAIENTTDEPSKVESLYLTVFDLALSISDYDSVERALTQLISHEEIKSLLTKFIEKLILEQNLKLIFPPNENKVYRTHYKLIDSILAQVAHSAPLLSSLKMYQVLSAWRLFGCCALDTELADQRGSCEALYHYIQRYKNETKTIDKASKFQVLQMYLLILNNLKSLQDADDQWFFNDAVDLAAASSSSWSIVTANRIQIEYLEWMKNLETDLSTIE